MNIETSQILTSAAVIAASIILKFVIKRVLNRKEEQHGFQSSRKAMISKVITFGLFLLTGLILLGIWEVNPEDLAIYLASVFTIIGVAFFAQWSHLSNITAAIIIYFNHPVAIGDEITIQDEPPLHGTISDIGLFVMTLITKDKRKLMFTNTLFLQKVLSTTIKKSK
jgi:small-conductance mechanosensitive channel